MIIAVYTPTIRYTSNTNIGLEDDIFYTTVYNCTFKQTDYGSVIINNPTNPNTIELYPNAIKHVIHSK